MIDPQLYRIPIRIEDSSGGLSKIFNFVREGWPQSGRSRSHVTQSEGRRDSNLEMKLLTKTKPFTAEFDCLLWVRSVVILEALKAGMQKVLHSMTSSKQLAWNYIWWPKLDEAIESMIKMSHVST